MKRIALVAALLAVMGTIIPASAGDLPSDTDPLGTLELLPAGTDQAGQVPAGAQRLILRFADGMDAQGAFGVKFSGVFVTETGPRVPQLLGYSDGLDDAGSASPTGPLPPTQVFAGMYGDVGEWECKPAAKPGLWAYSTTETVPHTTVSNVPLGLCQVKNGTTTPVLDEAGLIVGYETPVATYVPGFWLDVTATPDLTGVVAALIQYASVYNDTAPGGDFYTEANGGGTGSLLLAPGV